MFGKKRKILKRVRTGLKKRTAKLSPDERTRAYSRTRVRMAVKRALDKMGIKDRGKRQSIHKIMQSVNARRILLQDWKGAGLMTLSKDQFMLDCMSQLGDELGSRGKVWKFLLYLPWINLNPQKEKT